MSRTNRQVGLFDRSGRDCAQRLRRIGVCKVLVPAALAAVCAFSPASASAGLTALTTGTITAGPLSVSTSATPTFSAVLAGTADQTPTYTLPMTVIDATGSGAGWHATVTSTEFANGGTPVQRLATGASTITGVAAVAIGGTDTAVSNSVGYPLGLPSGLSAPTAVSFFDTATTTGLGEFTLTPTVEVAIPANTYAGTYTSTVTLAIVSAP